MKKRFFVILLRIVIGLSLICLLYRKIDLSSIRDLLVNVDVLPLFVLFFLMFINTLISSYKWQILLKADSINVSLRALLSSYLVGSFFNLFLPSNIGGDVYRTYDISRYTSRLAHSFASVFADRFSGFIALAGLGLLFSVIGYSFLPLQKMVLIPLCIFIIIMLIVWGLFEKRILKRVLKIARLDKITIIAESVDKFLASINSYKKRLSVLIKIMILSFVFQFLFILCIYTLASALHLRINFIYFCIFVPVIALIEALPISIYGIGIRDAAYLFFYCRAGISEVEALSMALLFLFSTVVYSLSGGLIFIFRSFGRR